MQDSVITGKVHMVKNAVLKELVTLIKTKIESLEGEEPKVRKEIQFVKQERQVKHKQQS